MGPCWANARPGTNAAPDDGTRRFCFDRGSGRGIGRASGAETRRLELSPGAFRVVGEPDEPALHR